MLKYILLSLLVFSLGCVQPHANNGLVISLQPDPSLILEKGITRVNVDVTNTDIKRLENVKVEVFNPGIMARLDESACSQAGDLKTLLAEEFRTFLDRKSVV